MSVTDGARYFCPTNILSLAHAQMVILRDRINIYLQDSSYDTQRITKIQNKRDMSANLA